jgi:hypothetical protein
MGFDVDIFEFEYGFCVDIFALKRIGKPFGGKSPTSATKKYKMP